MRILQVIHSFPPDNWSGSEIYALRLSQALARTDEVAVFCRRADPGRPEFEVDREVFKNLPIYRLNNNFLSVKRFEDIYRHEAINQAFCQVLNEWNPDIVHFHHLTCLSTDFPVLCKDRGMGTCYTLHDYWLLCQRGQFLDLNLEPCQGPGTARCLTCLQEQVVGPASSLISRLWGYHQIHKRRRHIAKISRFIDRFIAPSRFLADFHVKCGFDDERIEVLGYGFDHSLYSTSKKASPFLRFGFIGSIMVSKGTEIAIQAFRLVAGDELRLTINGRYFPYHGLKGYMDQIKTSSGGDQRIQIEGEFRHDRVQDIFSEIDVLIFPSIWYENSPLTIQEAFLTGTPVLVSDFGAMPELARPGQGCLLFQKGNAEDLADKIRLLCDDRSMIETLRRTMPSVKSIAENASELKEIYDDITR
ncbi:glycosyltransferase family 4 protein [candidate division CSSED10-310 bacterium]|uniref:Glycosyltransferase family 4 protein n=1 Tax=candidate division CSSED10-310 bacterium TaxID=2855610 RepID=A0ABV6YWD7_UNCC1